MKKTVISKKNVNEGNNRTKKQRIAAGIATVICSAALLTTATYAWFSLTNSPQVNKLTLKAGTSGSLQICETQTGTFADTVSLTLDSDCCLRPITTVDGINFYQPNYGTDGKVASVKTTPLTSSELAGITNKKENNHGAIIVKDFYLKATTTDGASEVGIKLSAPQGTNAGTKIANAVEASHGAEAVRIGFQCGANSVIFEPNADAEITGRILNQPSLSGFNTMTVYKQSEDNYLFAKNGTIVYDQVTSDELFKIPTNSAVKVTMTIWLEGADADCINGIMGSSIETELRFISTDINN